MILSAEQQRAQDSINTWLKDPHDQVHKLFGYAGTGKTSITKDLTSGVSGTVLFGAFTGKAASVMEAKGCTGATTIHRLIYTPKSKSRERLTAMQRELDNLKQAQAGTMEFYSKIAKLENRIIEEQQNVKRPAFNLNLESQLKHAKLLVIDEGSMINEQIGRDILSFGVKVLVLSDPGQLPPVYGASFFGGEPDTMLQEIHRQARDNPIIDLATRVRNRETLEEGQYGTSRVMDWADLEPDVALNHNQIIVGRNDTRRGTNQRIRQLNGMKHADHHMPVVGDTVVCLKNNHDLGLLNGTQWTVKKFENVDQHSGMLQVVSGQDTVECLTHTAPFKGQEIPHWDHQKIDEFDYGYAMTCHKAQGSQWDSVLVLDQSRMFKAHRYKWLYTAITRAAQRVTVAR